MRGRRWGLVGAAAFVAVVGPAAGWAYAPALTCPGVVDIGNWQRLPIPRFQPIADVRSTDQVTSFAIADTRPELVVVSNGKRLQVSTVDGCAWSNGLALGLQPTGELPLSGATSTIVATAVLSNGRVLSAVREGDAAASRPHIVASDDGKTGYRTYDTGLPAQGSPTLLVAADDGRTVYLALSPVREEGPAGAPPLPGLPDVPGAGSGARPGLLYASTDGGHSWLLASSTEDLPAGAGLDRLAVDHQNPQQLYAISNGLLLNSNNGGAPSSEPGSTTTSPRSSRWAQGW